MLKESATGLVARYTNAGGSYYSPMLSLKVDGVGARYPLYDPVGTARMLVNDSATITDTYNLEAFGKLRSSTGTTPNPYRYGGAWGYITDPSGMLQLGARSYWPEIGRFLQQDPIGDGMNWYGYAGGNPVAWSDPDGLKLTFAGDATAIGEALVYLERVPAMKTIIGNLRNSRTDYLITTNDRQQDDYNLGTHEIRWDPRAAQETTSGDTQSPALLLGHELGHADSPADEARRRAGTRDRQYGNAEERRVITQIETPTAKALGEGVRANHYGKFFGVGGPLCRKRKEPEGLTWLQVLALLPIWPHISSAF